MKNLMLGIAMFCLSLFVQAQNLDITVKNVEYYNLAVELKRGLWYNSTDIRVQEVQQALVEGMPGSDELFLIQKQPVFVPQGETLKIEVDDKEVKFIETSILTKENLFLAEVYQQRQEYYNYIRKFRSYTYKVSQGKETEKPEPFDLDAYYNRIEGKINDFKSENPHCHANFIDFIKLDNFFFKLKNQLDFRGTSSTFYTFSKEELAILNKTIEFSDNPLVVLSDSYRKLVTLYLGYLRIEDPKHHLENTSDYLRNETLLANYFIHPEVKDFVIANNMMSLALWNGGNQAYENTVKCLPKPWEESLLDQAERFQRGKGGEIIPVETVDFPEMSGEDQYGNPVSLADFKGKWVFVDVWATWCGPCKAQIPFVELQMERLHGKNVEFLSISVDIPEQKEQWIKTIEEKGMTTKQMLYMGEVSELNKQLGIKGIPHFVLINPEGKLVYNRIPSPSTGVFDRVLQVLIEDK